MLERGWTGRKGVDSFRCMWCLTTSPGNISVYLPKHLPICKQPLGPCLKSKVTKLLSWLKLGRVPQRAWRGSWVLNAAGGQDPLCLPWGWGQWPGWDRSWVEGHSHGSGRCGSSARAHLAHSAVRLWTLDQQASFKSGSSSVCVSSAQSRPPFLAKSLPQKYLHMVPSSWFCKDLANCDTWPRARVSIEGDQAHILRHGRKDSPPVRGAAGSKASGQAHSWSFVWFWCDFLPNITFKGIFF